MRNFVPNLVYSARGNEVDTVIVDGKILVENKIPKTFNLQEILKEVQAHADVIGEKAARQFNEINGKNAKYMRENKL
jgi:5-methylthioadenosine/S-adenosylhomocysteine deaminase